MATRRRTKAKNSSTPLGYIIFGIILGIGIAAAAAYYVRSSQPKTPAAPVISQKLTPPPKQSTTPPVQTAVIPTQTTVTSVAQATASSPPTQATSSTQAVTPVQTTTPVTTTTTITSGPAVSLSKPPSTTPPKKQDDIGELITKINTPALPAAKNTESNNHYLQIGAFKNAQDAEAKRAELLMQGFSNINITKVTINSTEFSRVRIGPFPSENALKEAQERLKANKINATVIR